MEFELNYVLLRIKKRPLNDSTRQKELLLNEVQTGFATGHTGEEIGKRNSGNNLIMKIINS